MSEKINNHTIAGGGRPFGEKLLSFKRCQVFKSNPEKIYRQQIILVFVVQRLESFKKKRGKILKCVNKMKNKMPQFIFSL